MNWVFEKINQIFADASKRQMELFPNNYQFNMVTELEEYRRTTGQTQKQIASKLYIDPRTYRRWLKGESRPNESIRPRIMALLKK
jgi:DNA-binding XRE family transcriptional regulator